MARKKNILGEYISGRILVNKQFLRRLPVVLYVAFLMLVYMTYNFSIQGRYDQMNKLKNEIRALQTVYIASNVKCAKMTQRPEIERLLKQYNVDVRFYVEQPRIIE